MTPPLPLRKICLAEPPKSGRALLTSVSFPTRGSRSFARTKTGLTSSAHAPGFGLYGMPRDARSPPTHGLLLGFVISPLVDRSCGVLVPSASGSTVHLLPRRVDRQRRSVHPRTLLNLSPRAGPRKWAARGNFVPIFHAPHHKSRRRVC